MAVVLASVAVPAPLSANVRPMPLGKPDSLSRSPFSPLLVVTIKVPATPAVNVAESAPVIAGA